MQRLTEEDKKFGPITYGRSSWNPWRIVLSSGDCEEEARNFNSLTVYAFGWVARLSLPNIIRPFSIRHKAMWDEATVKRMGRNWYDETFPREYGFCLSDGHLIVFLGAQTHDSLTTKSWSCFLPWTQWRHIRISYFDANGNLFWENKKTKKKPYIYQFEQQHAAKEMCPARQFLLEDYDGTEIIATTIIEEREWHRGEGWFKWLRYFFKPMVKRVLDISYDKETGPEKGSWKGGTVGESIEMYRLEDHSNAIMRHCHKEHERKGRKYNLKYVREIKE